jgi:hypothetical protein
MLSDSAPQHRPKRRTSGILHAAVRRGSTMPERSLRCKLHLGLAPRLVDAAPGREPNGNNSFTLSDSDSEIRKSLRPN